MGPVSAALVLPCRLALVENFQLAESVEYGERRSGYCGAIHVIGGNALSRNE